MLETERQYFQENQETLSRDYPGKFVVIQNRDLLGSFDTLQDALSAGARQFGLSPFLVRRTDELAREVSIPALTLGILNANANIPTGGSSSNT